MYIAFAMTPDRPSVACDFATATKRPTPTSPAPPTPPTVGYVDNISRATGRDHFAIRRKHCGDSVSGDIRAGVLTTNIGERARK
jgi:hypothetical protein